MTQATVATQKIVWAVEEVNEVFAAILRNHQIADAIDFEYDGHLDWFYNAAGQKSTKFDVGYCAYFKGVRKADLTSDEMRRGFMSADGEMKYAAAFEGNYSNEPGYRTSWETF